MRVSRKHFKLLVITLVVVIASCSSCSTTETVPSCQLSNSEAIALAQNYLDDALDNIPCARGRTLFWVNIYETDATWSVYLSTYDAKYVDYGPFQWKVHCESRLVSPIGDTWDEIQFVIAIYSASCN
jgi:hypothetical protein